MAMQIEPSGASREVRKAVIPAGGLGTSFLPATKVTPKEMLPVVDKPAIQYVAEESVAAGCDDVLIVTGPSKWALEDHFDAAPQLESALADQGDTEDLAVVRHPSELADIHYVRQGGPFGLGHAVLRAARHVGGEPFVLLLGDELIDERDPVLPAMLAVRARYGGSVIAVMDVADDQVGSYGCAVVGNELDDGVLELSDLVEKPDPACAPSHTAIIGRYVLDPAVFCVLRHTQPGHAGFVQLTDALRTLLHMPAREGGGVRAVRFTGRRYELVDKLSYLQAVVRLTCDRADLGGDFRAWLRSYVGELGQD